MQRWEYLTIGITGTRWSDSLGRTGKMPNYSDPMWGDPTVLLNELGEQGWELAGVYGVGGSSFSKLYLKRPRP